MLQLARTLCHNPCMPVFQGHCGMRFFCTLDSHPIGLARIPLPLPSEGSCHRTDEQRLWGFRRSSPIAMDRACAQSYLFWVSERSGRLVS